MDTSTVDRAFQAALYAPTDDHAALDTGASLLAADPAADAEVTRRGVEFVAGAWRRGWQPADVVRLVRRDLDDVHERLVAALILDQAPDDRPRGPRWAAQLAQLAEEAPVTPARTDRFTHATTVLELYRLLLRLPTLEDLDEPQPRPRTDTTTGTRTESRMLTRIRALLAKAEATEFPDEAEALSAKAQELMARHSIGEALLAGQAPGGTGPTAWRIGVDQPYEQAKAVLLDAVATANHCRAVWNEPFGYSTVVGFAPDLEVVELLYTSLLVQATTAMTKAEAAQRAGGRRRTKTFRQSFLAAYAHRIGVRLASAAEETARQAAEEAAGEAAGQSDGEGRAADGLLPVLASREAAVTEHAENMFPETTTTRLRGVTDAAGWTEGSRAADRAEVRSRRRLD